MKNLSLKILGFCLLFFAGVAIAQAQAVQAAEPPSSISQDWDAQHLKQNQQDLANQNSGNDDTKFNNWQNQQQSGANGQDDAAEDAALQSAATQPAAQDLHDEAEGKGYYAIPGFTPTGDQAVDGPAYEAALQALKSDASAFDAFAEANPTIADKL